MFIRILYPHVKSVTLNLVSRCEDIVKPLKAQTVPILGLDWKGFVAGMTFTSIFFLFIWGEGGEVGVL